uniref:Uncharacterized protein n=1 Tax=Wuchereria bancrofti TaxID=6293 RepID=A0AAF5Q5D2_WUCBA
MCKEDPQERIHAFEIVSKLGKIGENVESLKSLWAITIESFQGLEIRYTHYNITEDCLSWVTE